MQTFYVPVCKPKTQITPKRAQHNSPNIGQKTSEENNSEEIENFAIDCWTAVGYKRKALKNRQTLVVQRHDKSAC